MGQGHKGHPQLSSSHAGDMSSSHSSVHRKDAPMLNQCLCHTSLHARRMFPFILSPCWKDVLTLHPHPMVPMPEGCPPPSSPHTGEISPSISHAMLKCSHLPPLCSKECPHLSPHCFRGMSPPIPSLFWEDVLCSDLSPCSMIWGPSSPTPRPPCAIHHPARRAGPSCSTSLTPSLR